MMAGRGLTVMVGIVAAVLLAAALKQASSVFAPLVLALFMIALVWPLQRRLQTRIPRLLALVITLLVTLAVMAAFASLIVWSFGRVGRELAADTARYQAHYDALVAWLDSHGLSISGLWTEYFNFTFALRAAQQFTGRINTTLSFWFITLVYFILALLEVDDMRRRVERLHYTEAARIIVDGTTATGLKLRRYVLVRTQMSILTGLLVWAFAAAVGLQFAPEWGAITFALNYIPVLGPFVATLFPTVVAIAQFDTWLAVIGTFVCLNIIQFVVGSYVEPRIAGNVLSMSPTLVLFAIFFWSYMWGLFGAFIGVPIAIAILTFCAQHASSRWVADLFGGQVQEAKT
jgi:predicted PurR-regulated permease PerM